MLSKFRDLRNFASIKSLKNGIYLDSVGSEVSPLSFLEHVVRWVQPAMVLDFFEQWSFPVKK